MGKRVGLAVLSRVTQVALAVFAASGLARAEGVIGNGAGGWVCREASGEIRWVKLVDFFEAENEYGLKLREFAGKGYEEILKDVMEKTVHGVNDHWGDFVGSELESVRENLAPVKDAEMLVVDDALYDVKPLASSCEKGSITYEQIANYRTDGLVLLNSNLFEHAAFSEASRAAVYVHEAVYAFLRRHGGATNSVDSRVVVGLLFSELGTEEIARRVLKQIWRLDREAGSCTARRSVALPEGVSCLSSKGAEWRTVGRADFQRFGFRLWENPSMGVVLSRDFYVPSNTYLKDFWRYCESPSHAGNTSYAQRIWTAMGGKELAKRYDWKLPTAYPEEKEGEWGFPEEPSEFRLLVEAGLFDFYFPYAGNDNFNGFRSIVPSRSSARIPADSEESSKDGWFVTPIASNLSGEIEIDYVLSDPMMGNMHENPGNVRGQQICLGRAKAE